MSRAFFFLTDHHTCLATVLSRQKSSNGPKYSNGHLWIAPSFLLEVLLVAKSIASGKANLVLDVVEHYTQASTSKSESSFKNL